MFFLLCSPLTIRHSPRLFKLLGNEVVEGVLDEGLDEVVGGVVGAGVGAVVAFDEGEGGAVAFGGDDGLVFEEAFVNRAEFLDVEGSVVDAHALAGARVGEEAELAQAIAEEGVGEAEGVEGFDGGGREEVAREGADAEGRTVVAGLEEAEGGEESGPEIVVGVFGEAALFGEAAESLEAVVAVIDVALAAVGVGRENEVALFDDKEEEEAVNEAEKRKEE